MPERIGGNTFYSDDEARRLGLTLSEEEQARSRAVFDQFNAEREATAPASDRGSVDEIDPELRKKLDQRYGRNDGGEFAGWTLDGDHWRDGAGNVVYTRGLGGWYDTAGTLVWDFVGNRVDGR